MKITYKVEGGIYRATGPRGYGCLANSPEQLKAYLDSNFGEGQYTLEERQDTPNTTPPAIGERWVGQGGIYAGIVPARAGQKAYHLILGDDIGRFEWGPYGEQAPATNRTHGDANTQALVEADDDYPAAQAAFDHEADGHKDFYLPAIAELYEASLNLGLQPLGWVWSSSQFSALSAYTMDFEHGWIHYRGKFLERLVRPVRRLLIQ